MHTHGRCLLAGNRRLRARAAPYDERVLDEFTLTQKRALAVLTVIALVFGAYFLRSYAILIAVAAVLAYLFSPMYNRLRTKMNVGLSATVTLLAAIAIVAVPLGGVIFLAVLQ